MENSLSHLTKMAKPVNKRMLLLHNCVFALSLALVYQTKICQMSLETSADSGVKPSYTRIRL